MKSGVGVVDDVIGGVVALGVQPCQVVVDDGDVCRSSDRLLEHVSIHVSEWVRITNKDGILGCFVTV